ncbi:unnamed protein product [Lactuca virosa]|uniref:Uncharacterized protein n=1 Tax=Lactuca virosa TaxID=75947 RepID=A0AAU9NAG0_9ASTR|nr:unnamed protein product [Lactuca virosa]
MNSIRRVFNFEQPGAVKLHMEEVPVQTTKSRWSRMIEKEKTEKALVNPKQNILKQGSLSNKLNHKYSKRKVCDKEHI